MVKKKRSSKRKGRSAAFMRSINPYLNKAKATKFKTKRTMAKRRKSTRRKSYGRKSGSILGVNTAMALGAIAYGAIRSKTSDMLAPVTAKIPLGNISDEATMLIVTTLGKKFLVKKQGVLRDMLTAGQTIELARIGEAVISGDIKLGGSTSTSSNGYVFA